MITCKEDLINTYIENDHGELRDLYVEAMNLFGINAGDGKSFNYLFSGDKKYIACMTEFNRNGQSEWSSNYQDVMELKKLTLSDLKPRNKVEYEKVTESIFDLKDEFCAGLLFTKKFNQEWHQIKTEEQLGNLLSMNDDPTKNGIYRKVERPVEWWEDAAEFVKENSCNLHPKANHLDDGGFYVESKMTRDQWCDFARILLEQEDENKNNASS